LPFIIYFCLVIITRTYTFEEKIRQPVQPIWTIIHYYLTISIIPFIFYSIGYELMQFLYKPERYSADAWNVIDIFSAIMNIFLITTDLLFLERTDIVTIYRLRQLSAVACLLMYGKLFYYLRIFDATAPFVRMLIEVVKSIKIFILVFCFFIIAMANSFFILTKDMEIDNKPFIENPIDAIVYAYFISLGEFDTQ